MTNPNTRLRTLQRVARSLRERYAIETTPAELDREITGAAAQLRCRLEAQGLVAPDDDAMLVLMTQEHSGGNR